ncbi:alkaline phosphatase family protein [Rhodohalobacter sp. 8-1]|uniref:alkaline phosphatase family protein n=1 Tax=Rhodohalobacter sp. 8-1 TaxID=3131972 RepID=UPI0030EF0992
MKISRFVIPILIPLVSLVFFSGCQPAEKSPSTEKVLLISIDGFRHDYRQMYHTPNLDQFADEGSQAEFLIPVFPTKTFPNHYSIATGLYTENTGLVSNNMYDPEFDAYYSLADREAVQDARWYEGEPIWLTAEKQEIPAAPLFWPGSEAPIGGKYASYWSPYDEDLPYKARVDSVIHWLQMEGETAPGFMTLYFSKVDTYGHWYGPDSDSVAVALKEVDEHLGYLIEELNRIGKQDILNILIVSDHGMMEVSEERVILLDELIDLRDVEITDWAPVAAIRPKPGEKEYVFGKLKASEKNYTVYLKDDLPDRYGYKNHRRVSDIVLIADPGYTITSHKRLISADISGGTHGYDNREPEMRGIFMARGPSIKRDQKIGPVQNIHLYELMSHLLNIEPAFNDGSLDSLRQILK